MNRTRIAFFTASLEVGGSERQMVALNAGLADDQYEKHIICLSGYGPLEGDARATNATLHDIAYPRIRTAGTISLRSLPAAFGALHRLVKLLRDVKPDILHTMLPVCNVMGSVAGKFARVPHIVCTKLALGVYRDTSRLLPILEDMTDGLFDLVHCKSQGIVEDVTRREPIPVSRTRVIYNGLHALRYENVDGSIVRNEFGLAPDATVIGMVANLIPYKGHSDVIDAMPEIVARYPEIRFLFVGRDTGILGSVREQARALGVLEHITFTGERRDIPELMAAMDLFVSASHQEGFSNVLLEAMASALPIVATRVGGNPEAVKDGVTGIIVAPHSARQIEQALMTMLADREKAREMGQRGRARVRELFSYEAMISGLRMFYGEVLAGSPKLKG